MKPTTNLATATTPDGASLMLQEHDGEFFLKVGGIPLMSTTACSSEQTMSELACANVGPAPTVLIGGLGFGFTLRRVLELVGNDATVEVAELLPIIVQWNREFLQTINGLLLDDPRTVVREEDVFDIIRKGGPAHYDAILLDVDNSPDPLVDEGNSRLYDRRGVALIAKSLKPGGRIVFWSAHPDKAFAKSLQRDFKNVQAIPAKAYPKAKRFTHTLFVGDRK
ncbi:MAG: spermine synthase [Akkermansiaceae bacterium]